GLLLKNDERAVAESGQPPTRTAGFNANNVLQWCFYYPAVLNLRDLSFAPEEELALKESLTAYRQGNLLAALAHYPSDRHPGSESEQIYRATLFLSVGQVAQTEAALNELYAAKPSKRAQALAAALRQLIAAVKRDVEPRESSVQ